MVIEANQFSASKIIIDNYITCCFVSIVNANQSNHMDLMRLQEQHSLLHPESDPMALNIETNYR